MEQCVGRRKRVNIVELVGVAAILLFIALVIWVYTTTVQDESKAKKEKSIATHEAVMATTYDASNGSGLARARHAMTYNPDGSCTITVQQYVRKSTNDLFINSPRIETTAFTPKQCER